MHSRIMDVQNNSKLEKTTKDKGVGIIFACVPIHNDVAFFCKGFNEHLIKSLVLYLRLAPWCLAPH